MRRRWRAPWDCAQESDIQIYLDKRRPGQSRHTTQRREPDEVKILSGVFEGQTTGTAVSLVIENVDQRSRDYSEIMDKFRPGHADFTYWNKYGIRDYRGGGRSSARETAVRVAAGAIARKVFGDSLKVRGALVQIGDRKVDRAAWDWDETAKNDFWSPDPGAAADWETMMDGARKAGSSLGAVIEVVASGVPVGLGAPIYGKLDADLASAMMSINAVKGVEIGAGFDAVELSGEENADEMRMSNDGEVEFLSNSAGGMLGHKHGAGYCRPICRQTDEFDSLLGERSPSKVRIRKFRQRAVMIRVSAYARFRSVKP